MQYSILDTIKKVWNKKQLKKIKQITLKKYTKIQTLDRRDQKKNNKKNSTVAIININNNKKISKKIK